MRPGGCQWVEKFILVARLGSGINRAWHPSISSARVGFSSTLPKVHAILHSDSVLATYCISLALFRATALLSSIDENPIQQILLYIV